MVDSNSECGKQMDTNHNTKALHRLCKYDRTPDVHHRLFLQDLRFRNEGSSNDPLECPRVLAPGKPSDTPWGRCRTKLFHPLADRLRSNLDAVINQKYIKSISLYRQNQSLTYA